MLLLSRGSLKLGLAGVVEEKVKLPCDGPPGMLSVAIFNSSRSSQAVLCCPGRFLSLVRLEHMQGSLFCTRCMPFGPILRLLHLL